jgi:hypothetical protein
MVTNLIKDETYEFKFYRLNEFLPSAMYASFVRVFGIFLMGVEDEVSGLLLQCKIGERTWKQCNCPF